MFILQPHSQKPCDYALCEYVHGVPDNCYPLVHCGDYEYQVSVEPLIDWMTLDPVPDVQPFTFNVYRRNKQLLHEFALTNKQFIPQNPWRFCLECLIHLAGERNNVWYLMKEESEMLRGDIPLPWPKPGDGNDIEMMQEAHAADEPHSPFPDGITPGGGATSPITQSAEYKYVSVALVIGFVQADAESREFRI